MSGMWKRSHGGTIEAPPNERGGNSYVLPNATARFRADGCLKETDPPKRADSLYVSVSLVWSYGSLGFSSPFAGA
jgi:hypothetical protein